jgi:tRNA(Ile)-lysidine synthase
MAEADESRYVVTAHHADDQLETLLMRLLRGASVRGLAGMAWRRPLPMAKEPPGLILLRPLLHTDRAAIQRYLADLKQPWCEDHTNRDLTRWRARLRAEVLPILRSLRPDVARRYDRPRGPPDSQPAGSPRARDSR